MVEAENEWNDPPGVDLDESVEKSDATEKMADRKNGNASPRRPRGPFSRLRNVLNWIFWGGLILAAAIGGFTDAGVAGVSPIAGATKLALAFFVTIGIWVAAAWWLAWIIDKILVYLKH